MYSFVAASKGNGVEFKPCKFLWLDLLSSCLDWLWTLKCWFNRNHYRNSEGFHVLIQSTIGQQDAATLLIFEKIIPCSHDQIHRTEGAIT